ncbi:TPA: hypothetical protein ACK2W5_002541, partial [Klebsiella oxytoca]
VLLLVVIFSLFTDINRLYSRLLCENLRAGHLAQYAGGALMIIPRDLGSQRGKTGGGAGAPERATGP